ncbi:DUF2188 domain-containing protein [Flavobacterium qiangtangense]|uniref:DUF2188 domain-containing protein n=1 Tax=Flavobacterium qiangtangense TaxID=1442595 RepID=A0ABW1PL11_9FLAO
MSKLKNYHVLKSSDGWIAKASANIEVRGTTRAEVVKKTTDLAKKEPAATVHIHTSEGTVQYARTYVQGAGQISKTTANFRAAIKNRNNNLHSKHSKRRRKDDTDDNGPLKY